MFLLLISLVSLFLFIWLYMKWYKIKRYWKVRGVPYDIPHPIVGSLTFLLRQNPAHWMRQVYNDFKSPFVGVWVFWRPALIINSPELARKILVKDSDNFRNRFLSSGKTDPTGALTLFLVNDPTWSSVRRRLTSVFTAAKLRNHNIITQVKARDLVQRIADENANNNVFNLRTVFTDYTTDVIGESAFGFTSESAKTGNSVMREVTRELMEYNLHRGLSWWSIFFIPELVDIFRLSLFPKVTMEKLRKIFRTIIEKRGGYDRQIKDPKDLLDALLKIKQEAAVQNIDMSEDLLLAQAANFLLGGFDTSGAALTWIIYELAWNPHCQQKLYEEIVEVKQKLGDKDFDLNTLSEMTYLNCVIKETLRIFPPMGWLDRIAASDYQIDENLRIAAGTIVYVNAVGMHSDPDYFPDPYVFNPDRFLPENERNIIPYTFMPFGEGPRNCVGMRFAYQTVWQGLAAVILNYEVRKLPNTPKPMDVRVETNGMFLMPLDEKMLVQFISRKEL